MAQTDHSQEQKSECYKQAVSDEGLTKDANMKYLD